MLVSFNNTGDLFTDIVTYVQCSINTYYKEKNHKKITHICINYKPTPTTTNTINASAEDCTTTPTTTTTSTQT